MTDHYVTAMTHIDTNTLLFACRCGATVIGLIDAIGSIDDAYDIHLDNERYSADLLAKQGAR